MWSQVSQQCKENIFAIQTLKDFQHTEDNKDQGVNVREKSKQLVALLKDDERLRAERTRALKAKERFAQATARVGSEALAKYGSSSRRDSYNSDATSPRGEGDGAAASPRSWSVPVPRRRVRRSSSSSWPWP
ncbi:hypothetical protein MTO96_041662 [Rhipicephalus appendiculatus]